MANQHFEYTDIEASMKAKLEAIIDGTISQEQGLEDISALWRQANLGRVIIHFTSTDEQATNFLSAIAEMAPSATLTPIMECRDGRKDFHLSIPANEDRLELMPLIKSAPTRPTFSGIEVRRIGKDSDTPIVV